MSTSGRSAGNGCTRGGRAGRSCTCTSDASVSGSAVRWSRNACGSTGPGYGGAATSPLDHLGVRRPETIPKERARVASLQPEDPDACDHVDGRGHQEHLLVQVLAADQGRDELSPEERDDPPGL